MVAKWKKEGHYDQRVQDLWNDYVPKHLLPRLYGFELMMAPYAIAHMKVGLKLFETGYRFGADERARIYLTNSLEPPGEVSVQNLFEETALAHEAQAVNAVKKSVPFTVVVGNPPYSHRANMLSPEQRALIEPYKFINGQRMKVRGALQLERNLNDDYVKFVRFSQELIAHTGTGVVGLITNNAYLENLTFPGMRNSLMATFGFVEIVNLHGSLKTGGQTPDGRKDENVFDIQQGVAISLFATPPRFATKVRRYIDLWGTRQEKEQLLQQNRNSIGFCELSPEPGTYLFVPPSGQGATEYQGWKPLDRIFTVFGTGVMTNRNNLTIGMTAQELSQSIKTFMDRRLDDQAVGERLEIKSNALWNLRSARNDIAKLNPADFFRPIYFRPFDTRTIFYNSVAVDNMRRAVMEAATISGNLTLLVSRQQFKQDFQHVLVTRKMFDECVLSGASREKASGFSLFGHAGSLGRLTLSSCESNLKDSFLPIDCPNESIPEAQLKFNFIYAILHSMIYRVRYADQLKRDYPRLPETGNLKLFRALAGFGGELIALHLVEFLLEDEKSKDANVKDWPVYPRLTEFIGKVPSLEIEKVSYGKKTVWLDKAQSVGFQGVPEEVWNFHIGSYQVCEKWLKDRKGRRLSADDVLHYHKIVTALHHTIRLMKEIDAVIEKHGGWPGAFQGQP
jgi:predicted helicase